MLDATYSFVHISSDEIILSNVKRETKLIEISDVHIALKAYSDARVKVYRTDTFSSEHYAIIIGNINGDKIPMILIHSACYTGDLLGSLHCDCQDQLHEALRVIGEYECGVLIYLSQDGRGIGTVNKFRAYEFQRYNQLDTVDANAALGFAKDERSFNPAIAILHLLDVSKCKLITNNPCKARALLDADIDVIDTVKNKTEKNKYNSHYINVKRSRLGHDIL